MINITEIQFDCTLTSNKYMSCNHGNSRSLRINADNAVTLETNTFAVLGSVTIETTKT